jgi:hypothetical protein
MATTVRPYISCAGATDKLLAKTDADFIYKLPDVFRFSKAAYTV